MPGFQHLLLPDFKPTNVANRRGQCGSDGLNFSQASRRSDIGAATTFLSDAATEGFRGMESSVALSWNHDSPVGSLVIVLRHLLLSAANRDRLRYDLCSWFPTTGPVKCLLH